ncbi:hypothetical protein VTO42DRAFT_6670 [Malbranchea cinnamomea]
MAEILPRNRNNDSQGIMHYYPAFCHKASPTYFAWVKMGAADVHRLKTRKGFEGQSLYFYNNHPIQFLCLAGVIVSRDEQARRTILVLDDSTGATIEVVCDKLEQQGEFAEMQLQRAQSQAALQFSVSERIMAEEEKGTTHVAAATRAPLNISPLVPGVVAKLKGTITKFRGMFQLHLERYVILSDTNSEVEFWEQRTRFLVDVLCVPWVLSDEEVERLRRECEEEEVRRVRKKLAKERRLVRMTQKRAEREEKDRLRIERRYAREEAIRQKLAAECAEASRAVGKRKKPA